MKKSAVLTWSVQWFVWAFLQLATLQMTLAQPVYAQSEEDKPLHVAVAANFATTFEEILREFNQQYPVKVLPSYASTGKLYAQIINGAPYALFLSADKSTSLKLEQAGYAGKRSVYAVGQLVLWSARPGWIDSQAVLLKQGHFERIAIANPALAPYGLAAQQTLQQLGLWTAVQAKLVQADSIAQVHQFVSSGNVELGFIAASQHPKNSGSFWQVPKALYDPIEQEMVLLKSAQHRTAANEFYEFMRSEKALKIIRSYGYDVP